MAIVLVVMVMPKNGEPFQNKEPDQAGQQRHTDTMNLATQMHAFGQQVQEGSSQQHAR